MFIWTFFLSAAGCGEHQMRIRRERTPTGMKDQPQSFAGIVGSGSGNWGVITMKWRNNIFDVTRVEEIDWPQQTEGEREEKGGGEDDNNTYFDFGGASLADRRDTKHSLAPGTIAIIIIRSNQTIERQILIMGEF